MRILEIAPPWFAVPPANYGGTELIVSLLADGLVAAGHDVTLIASGGSRTTARLRSVFDTPPSQQMGDPWVEARHVLTGYLDRHEFDIVHDHSGVTGILLGALLDGPPVVHTLHGPWVEKVAAVHELVAGRLHLVAISADQARRAPAHVRLAGVVHNAVPVHRYAPRLDRRGESSYLAYVGRANPEKGPEVAIEVARRLGRRLKMLIKISEPAERDYWQTVVAPRLADADVEVLCTASTAEKARLYADADATLFPAQWPEPFGLVMAESMACGTPVVAYANGAAGEVVVNGVTGFLATPGDVDGLAAAVRGVREIDPATCRAWVEQRFSGPAMVRGYESIFDRIVAPQSRLVTLPPMTADRPRLTPSTRGSAAPARS